MQITQRLVSTLFLLSACGGSDLEPGAGDDPGEGTSTLTVTGTVSASPRVSNARSAGDFETEISVRLERAGQTVTTGTASVTSASGTVALVFDATNNNNGRWRGSAAGYDEVYILDVEDGADNLLGVRVDGPDIHHFTAPTAGATVDSTMPLAIGWSFDDGADSATVRADNIDDVAIGDTGTYSLAPGALRARRDQAEPNELRLRRTNRVTPNGAGGGSEWTVAIDNRIEVVAQPNPAL